MKKLLSLVVLGAILLAACGGGSGNVAATVDGEDVTVGYVEGLIESEGAAVTKEQFAEYLAVAIQWNILFDAAESEYGVTATDDEVAEEATRLYEDLAAEEQSREDFLAERGVTEEFLSNIARQGLLDVKIREQLREGVPEPTQEEIDEARPSLINACVSHILVPTLEEANEAMSRLESGEELGALATELSTDTQSAANNGILPCGSPNTYVPPFREAVLDATVGEVYSEPVESEFGFHVILVTDRTVPDDSEVEENLRDAAVLSELQTWFTGVMAGAEVTVDEEYGTWTSNPPGVTPPAS
jgi:parvulin-like peptidyl-prolyl isomerase